jgi:hypothetical protein
MEEMKVREYGGWTPYTCMKQNKEISCNCFKWGQERSRWGEMMGVDLTNGHYKPI